MRTKRGGAANVLIGLATAFAIVAVTLPLFLNPVWVAFEQGRAQAAAWTGFTEPQLRTATDAILADLVVGPPEFDVAVAGTPVLNEREQGHMRDVRGVFIGFFAVAVVLAALALFIVIRRRGPERTQSWVAALGGALGLIFVLIMGGIVSFVAFDALFETFHQFFFAGGSYTFDPATERLVQLFPFQFWQETAIVVGAVCIVLAGIVVAIATIRVSAADAREAAQGPAEVGEGSGTSMSATGPTR